MDKTMLKFKLEAAKREVIFRAKQVKNAVCNFCVQNPTAAAVIGSAAFGGLTTIVKDIRKDHRIRKENDRRDSRIYDRKADQWFDTRRPLTNKEKARLTERYNRGESKYNILKDMHLLR